MAMVKLKATLTITVVYDCPEDYAECENVSQLCRHEEAAIRANPSDFVDAGGAKFVAKVERVTAVMQAREKA